MEYFLKYHNKLISRASLFVELLTAHEIFPEISCSKLLSRASGVAQAYIIIHDLLALLTLSFNVQDIYRTYSKVFYFTLQSG